MSDLRDPTRSQGLRRAGRAEVNRNVFELHKRLRAALQEDDILSLRESVARPFMGFVESDAGKLERGEYMLQRMVADTIGRPSGWLQALVERAVRRGVDQVGQELKLAVDDLDPTEVINLHAAAADIEVEGIANETKRRMLRSVVRAVETKRTPEFLMREIRTLLRTVTKLRLFLMVNTSVVRAVNAGKLYGYRRSGVSQVGTVPEWLPAKHNHTHHDHAHDHVLHDRDTKKKKRATVGKIAAAKSSTKRRRDRMRGLPELVSVQTAGDDKVCVDCQSLAALGPYEIDDPTVSDLIPVHPNCRCAFVPWDDRRYSVNR